MLAIDRSQLLGSKKILASEVANRLVVRRRSCGTHVVVDGRASTHKGSGLRGWGPDVVGLLSGHARRMVIQRVPRRVGAGP